jgi:V8-like Glu-specific endopeptidase
MSDKLKVFLAYAEEDEEEVTDLYQKLKKAGFEPWMLNEDVFPGQSVRLEIDNAIRNTEAVIVCLSEALTKAGEIHRQIRLAVQQNQLQIQRSIFLIPLELEPVKKEAIPDVLLLDTLRVKYKEAGTFPALLNTLQRRAEQLGKTVTPEKASADVATPNLTAKTFDSLESIQAGKEGERWRGAGFLVTGAQSVQAVCRVETDQKPIGTGFLVGRDLVLTNYHVFREVPGADSEAQLNNIRFNFGYLKEGDRIKESDRVRAAKTVTSPLASSLDYNGLDFVLIKLDEPIGDRLGYLKLDKHDPNVGEELLILHHPSGWDMQFTQGKVVHAYDPQTQRLQHSVNTLGGSSGSPIFDETWHVVALHCAGSEEEGSGNRAIPIKYIYPKIEQFLA